VETSRRELILAGAAELFASRGYHGVSVDDLGTAAGVSGPALYRHFPSKEAILAHLLLDISRTLLEEGRRRVAAAPDPSAALESLVEWHVSFALSRPTLITVQARDLSSLPAGAQRRVRSLQRRYVELWVAAIMERTGAERATALAAAHAAFGLVNSTPHSARLPAERMAGLLHDMAVGALEAVVGG
jgi:AcrR family transcriptional regulator